MSEPFESVLKPHIDRAIYAWIDEMQANGRGPVRYPPIFPPLIATPRACCIVCRREMEVETSPGRPGPLVPHTRVAPGATYQELCESYQLPEWLR